jgi:uncharacterized protein YgiM (DUF1202 family)
MLTVIVLSGCKSADEQTFFIPTPEAEEDTKDMTPALPEETEEADEDENAPELTDEPVYVGKTTTKYVKLDNSGAILNIRSGPSRDSEVVGFLVHTEQIEVISIEDGWASFVYQGQIRYVSADYLVDKKPAYLTAPTVTPKPTPTKEPDPNEAPPEI